jgi:hypothetical protein
MARSTRHGVRDSQISQRETVAAQRPSRKMESEGILYVCN